VIREHNALIRGCLREHRGIEVAHTGDGILACFLVPKDAIACATAIQAALAARNLVTHQPPLHVRIGVHSGSALVEEDRLFGATVVAAVRICNQCQPGQVLVSSAVRASLPELVDCFRSCGQHVLKGFTEHMELFVVRRDFAAQLQQ
jgi:class 3 adenylate cyclase